MMTAVRRQPSHSRHLSTLVAAALCLLCITGVKNAQAGERASAAEPSFSVTPMLGWRAGGRLDVVDTHDRRSLDDASSFALALNLKQAPGRHYEALYSRQQSSFARAGGEPLKLDIEYLHVGGMLTWPRHRFESFITGTLGATRLDPRGPAGSRTRPSISLGLGLRIPFNRHLALRLETRGYLTLTDGDEEIFCLSAPPEQAGCAARYSGNSLLQFEALAGVSIGF